VPSLLIRVAVPVVVRSSSSGRAAAVASGFGKRAAFRAVARIVEHNGVHHLGVGIRSPGHRSSLKQELSGTSTGPTFLAYPSAGRSWGADGDLCHVADRGVPPLAEERQKVEQCGREGAREERKRTREIKRKKMIGPIIIRKVG